MGPFRWAIKRGSYVTESSSLPDFNIRLPCVDCRNCGIDGKTISAIMHHRSLKVTYKLKKNQPIVTISLMKTITIVV